MKELNELREVMLTLTDLYGTMGNNQKRNLWNAFEKLEKAITVTHCYVPPAGL
jgi:hypothetical protein